MTQSEIEVRSGDIVLLEARTARSYAKVEWWREGKLECESPRCEVDTTDFGAGEYIYHAIVFGSEGSAYSTVNIKTVPSEPLYTPKRLNPALVQPNKEKTFSIKNGEWQIFARSGAIIVDDSVEFTNKKSQDKSPSESPFNLKKLKKTNQISTVAKPRSDVTYKVPTGTQAFIRRVNQDEEWLIAPQSTFKIKDGVFELLSGQAIWRKLYGQANEAMNSSKSIAIVAGSVLENSGSWFMSFEIGFDKTQTHKATFKNIEGKNIQFKCKEISSETIQPGKSKVVILDDKGQCKGVESHYYSIGNLSATSSIWYNWWGKVVTPLPADRWRAEYRLTQGLKSEKELIDFAEAGLKDGYCTDVLDYLGSALADYKDNGKFLNALGSCQLQIGLFKQSLNVFSELERTQANPTRAAFMLGRSYQGLGQHDIALKWFREADRRDMEDRVLLARTAVKSAEAAKNSREQLRWLELAAIEEQNESLRENDKENAEIWREIRPVGASLTGKFYMDSQALPVNSKKASIMPEGTHTSRSVVFALLGDWWTTKYVTKDFRVRFGGDHSYNRPQEKGLDFAARSIHDFKVSMLIGEYLNAGQQPNDRWIFDFSSILGTGISGSERQRDHLGWSFTIARPKWLNLKIGFKSDKYLDPKPDGKDHIDLDLYRYTGEGDHSHIDSLPWFSIEDHAGVYYWKILSTYGTVDYRTGNHDAFDHILLNLDATFKYHLDHLSSLMFNPQYMARTYEGENGNDITSSLITSYNYHADALWKVTLFAGLENRTVSKDETASWSRQLYGVSMSNDF